MAPLQRAVSLAEVDAVPVPIEQDLDLDVAGTLEESLEDEAVVAEGGLGLPARGGELPRQPLEVAHGTHPLAAAAGRGLDEQWDPDPCRGGRQRGIGLIGVVVASGRRDA